MPSLSTSEADFSRVWEAEPYPVRGGLTGAGEATLLDSFLVAAAFFASATSSSGL